MCMCVHVHVCDLGLSFFLGSKNPIGFFGKKMESKGESDIMNKSDGTLLGAFPVCPARPFVLFFFPQTSMFAAKN